MGIRVIADVMLGDRRDHILALAFLEDAGLFAHYFEGCWNSLLRKEYGKAFGRIIALRKDVIFRVKPEQHIDLPFRRSPRLRLVLPGTSEVGNVQRRWRRTLAWNLTRPLSEGRRNTREQQC